MSILRTLLIVDDDLQYLADMKILLEKQYRVFTVQTGNETLETLREHQVHAILLDLMLARGESGLDVLKRIRDVDSTVPVIMITDYASVDTAVEAMKYGAYHYMSKTPDIKSLEVLIDKAMEERSIRQEHELLRKEVTKLAPSSLLGESPAMRRIFVEVQQIAQTKTPILLTGPSGTGKTSLAREIHRLSPRASKPFVVVDCGSIAPNVLESELFGHEKGAFTGATAMKKGLVEIANGGTLFIDEIAVFDPTLQIKFLRFLQDQSFHRVGGVQELHVDVRVIVATNEDLKKAVAEKRLREDLYYRIKVVEIPMPPLREHVDDIPILTEFFFQHFRSELNRRDVQRIHSSTIEYLKSQPWEGNVRELQNAIERAVLLCSGTELMPTDFIASDLGMTDEPKAQSYEQKKQDVLENFQREYIAKLLQETGGNISATAEKMGMSRQGLAKLMQKLGL